MNTLLKITSSVTILQGDTGSGKSTRTMMELQGIGWCSQPRKVNAESLAEYCQKRCSKSIGYCHGDGSTVTAKTQGVFCTHGVLLNKMAERSFSPDWIAIDECHEETREVSAILALARARLKAGWKTKVLIISATMNVEVVKAHFSDFSVEVIHMGGVKFPIVDLQFSPGTTTENREILKRLQAGRSGVMFLAGKRDCSDFIAAFPKSNAYDLILCTSETENLAKVVHGKGKPRLLVATNVLGAGITPGDGISFVGTTGMKKELREEQGIESLVTCECSQAELMQLRGRTGRTEAGEFLLFSYSSMSTRPAFPSAEIQRTMPHRIVLLLAEIGCKVSQLKWVTPPDMAKCTQSEQELRQLGAIGDNGKPTEIGKRLLTLPLAPKLGVALLEAEKSGSTWMAATIIAIMEIGQILKFGESTSNTIANYHSEEGSELIATAEVVANPNAPNHIFVAKNLFAMKQLRQKLLGAVRFSNGRDVSFMKHLYYHRGVVTEDRWGSKWVSTIQGLSARVDRDCMIPLSVNQQVYCEVRTITTQKGGQMHLATNITKI